MSGSYDKTLRIFRTDTGRSREVYYTKRMQRLSSVLWSSDNRVSEFIRFFLVGFLILNIFVCVGGNHVRLQISKTNIFLELIFFVIFSPVSIISTITVNNLVWCTFLSTVAKFWYLRETKNRSGA